MSFYVYEEKTGATYYGVWHTVEEAAKLLVKFQTEYPHREFCIRYKAFTC